MKLKILKDCRWCIVFKGTNLKEGDIVEVPDAGTAKDMIAANHAEAYIAEKVKEPKKEEAPKEEVKKTVKKKKKSKKDK